MNIKSLVTALFSTVCTISSLRLLAQSPQGRSFDHFGWNFPSLTEAEAHLATRDIAFDIGPLDYQGFKVAFLTGPHGIYLELLEP